MPIWLELYLKDIFADSVRLIGIALLASVIVTLGLYLNQVSDDQSIEQHYESKLA